jgi:hypothetical protein
MNYKIILHDRTHSAWLWHENEWVDMGCVDAEQFDLFQMMEHYLRDPRYRKQGTDLYEIVLGLRSADEA